MTWDPQIIEDGRSGQERAGGVFGAGGGGCRGHGHVPGGSGRGVCGIRVSGRVRGVVDDEGRVRACANRGDDGSWRGDVGG